MSCFCNVGILSFTYISLKTFKVKIPVITYWSILVKRPLCDIFCLLSGHWTFSMPYWLLIMCQYFFKSTDLWFLISPSVHSLCIIIIVDDERKNSWCQFCINLSIVLLKRIIKGDWYLICNCYSSHTIIILMSIASYTAVNTSTSCSHTYVRYPWVFVCIYFWEIYYINFIKNFKNSYITNAPRR